MTESQIKTLIKAWNAKAKREDDDFSKFVFLWFCFNAWLAYESRKGSDRAMVNWLKGDTAQHSLLKQSYDRPFDSGTGVLRSRIEALINYGSIPNSRRRHEKKIRVHSVDDFSNVVEAIYRVRCNLFHGGKEADNPHDQKLVKICGQILDKWISNLIATWDSSA